MRFGHQANSWGGVVGHPVGVTSIKDLFYLTPGDTLASRIASTYRGASSNLEVQSLLYLGAILLVISLITNVSAQLIVNKFQKARRMSTG